MLQASSISRGGCAGNLLVLLGKETDYRDAIISLLPSIYREASLERSGQIVSAIEMMLVDAHQQPSVRIAAGNALAQMGTPSSAEVIRSALSREDDPVIRSNLESDLELFEKQPRTGAGSSPN
jgi:HEAT repeat protein